MNWSIVWVITGRRGVSSERRRSSCSSYSCWWLGESSSQGISSHVMEFNWPGIVQAEPVLGETAYFLCANKLLTIWPYFSRPWWVWSDTRRHTLHEGQVLGKHWQEDPCISSLLYCRYVCGYPCCRISPLLALFRCIFVGMIFLLLLLLLALCIISALQYVL